MPQPGPPPFRHIAIEGPIGVGKSTLARRLGAHLGAELLLEQAAENPYLERFYADNAGYAFQTQVFFLFQRLRQVRDLAQTGMFSHTVVSDFIFAKDALFARLTLSDEEYRLYSQMYTRAAGQVPAPDLVIWLQASPDTLLQRIRRRGIPMERRIDEGYLRRLAEAYVRFFETFDAAPVLVVQTDRFDPAGRPDDFNALLARLEGLGGPREFLGPADESSLA